MYNKMNIFCFDFVIHAEVNMKEKCTKYEGLFIFSDEKTLLEHIETCPDCKAEHEKMQKISELLQEVKPHFVEKRRNYLKIKALCAIFMCCVCVSTMCVINLNPNISDRINYGMVLSAEDLGLPVDSYGLILVD